MTKVAVVLSGCGVYDGAEIHESVLTLLALDRAGAEYQCFAPNIDQMHVVNHLTGDVAEGESRNVLVESARSARSSPMSSALRKRWRMPVRRWVMFASRRPWCRASIRIPR